MKSILKMANLDYCYQKRLSAYVIMFEEEKFRNKTKITCLANQCENIKLAI